MVRGRSCYVRNKWVYIQLTIRTWKKSFKNRKLKLILNIISGIAEMMTLSMSMGKLTVGKYTVSG